MAMIKYKGFPDVLFFQFCCCCAQMCNMLHSSNNFRHYWVNFMHLVSGDTLYEIGATPKCLVVNT